MLIVADKQILCATCGKLIGLYRQPICLLKDRDVASSADDKRFYCNPICKEKAQV
jgi:hypothetical protein